LPLTGSRTSSAIARDVASRPINQLPCISLGLTIAQLSTIPLCGVAGTSSLLTTQESHIAQQELFTSLTAFHASIVACHAEKGKRDALIINRGAFDRRNDLARRGRSPSQGRSPRHSHGC
jgi:hypothetical protein